MDGIATLFLAGVGVAFICVGYQLFCRLPALSESGARTSRRAVFFVNIVPGALLALTGAGIFTAEMHSMILHRHATRQLRPAAQGTSRHSGSAGYSRNAV